MQLKIEGITAYDIITNDERNSIDVIIYPSELPNVIFIYNDMKYAQSALGVLKAESQSTIIHRNQDGSITGINDMGDPELAKNATDLSEILMNKLLNEIFTKF